MGGIFVSYRRQGSAGHAGRLFDRLRDHFGVARIFRDVDQLRPGEDFVEAIARAVTSCQVFIVVIGPGWVDVRDAEGRRRLDDPEDFVRLELETALQRDILVLPVLVEGAAMVGAKELPAPLRPLARLQAIELSEHRWDFDVQRLVRRIEDVVGFRRTLWRRLLDRRMAFHQDVVGAIVIAAVGWLLWFAWGRTWLNARQLWLWGAAVILAWLGWTVLLRSYRERSVQRPRAGFVRRASLPAVFLIAGGIWGLAAFEIHRIPPVPPDKHGIYVARLLGDPDDIYRDRIIDALWKHIEDVPLDDLVVLPLPRRIPDDGEARARELGRRGGAFLVLRGKMVATPGSVAGRLVGRVTVVDAEGMFDPGHGAALSGAALLGATGIEIEGPFGTTQQALAEFVVGYSRYHAGEYSRAIPYLQEAIRVMAGGEWVESQSSDRAVRSILASFHFYLGNTYFAIGDLEDASAQYEAAVTYSEHIREGQPEYIEALNNLAMLRWIQRDVAGTIQQLERAVTGCDARPLTSRSCATVSYNLGNAYNETGQFGNALRWLEDVRVRLEESALGAPPDTAARSLLARAHQGMAYGEARRAETLSDPVERRAAYQRALDAWVRGVGLFSNTPPPRFKITRARIHLGMGQVDRARALLAEAESEILDPDPARVTLHVLRASAEVCAGNLVEAMSSLTAIQEQAGRPATLAEMTEYQNLADVCTSSL